jgi:hypothetical protein
MYHHKVLYFHSSYELNSTHFQYSSQILAPPPNFNPPSFGYITANGRLVPQAITFDAIRQQDDEPFSPKTYRIIPT